MKTPHLSLGRIQVALMAAAGFVVLNATALLAQNNPAGALANPLAPSEPPRPKIHVAEPVFDFGMIRKKEPVRHAFRIQNQGTTTLKILNVRPGCGCTTVGAWTRELPPGGVGSITVQFDPRRFKGPISKSVTVTSNDPKTPTSILRLKGTIWTPLIVDPALVVFPALKDRNLVRTRSVKITNMTDGSVTLAIAGNSNPRFSAKLKPVVEGKEFELQITTVPPLNQGNNRTLVTLQSSNPEMSRLSVTASAYVLLPVVISPKRILLPQRLAGKRPLRRYITVLTRLDREFYISDLATDLQGGYASLQTIRPGKQYRIELRFPEHLDPQTFKGASVTFKTNHPDYRTVRIPIEPPLRPRTVSR